MVRTRSALVFCLLAVSGPVLAGRPPVRTRPEVVERLEVDKVWPGHPVGFGFANRKGYQFVAYYDAKRQMVVARRKLGEKRWERKRLPSRLGWDSHNYITIAFDRSDCLHVSGNMHCNPLVYFRSDKPLEVAGLKQHRRMTGDREGGVTYPQFMKDNNERLLYMYRSGSSGNGQRLINAYDEKMRKWTRLLKTPLLDGRKQSMNAYPAGDIRKGPDGYFHTVWVWRDTPDCRTNHDISYARSRDMVNWETVAGKPVKLPITPKNKDVIVDPIPTRKGLINISYGFGFDQQKRVVVHYHNYDKAGNSQIFLARFEGGKWARRQITDWKYRWKFGGGGCITVDLSAGPVSVLGKSHLKQGWRQKKYGRGMWKIDSATLKIVGKVTGLAGWMPREARAVRSEFKRLPLKVHWRSGPGCSGPKGRYFLRWETLGVNRDRPRKGPLPKPSALEVYLVKQVKAPAAGAKK
jgi:hypothetical protein